jgi:hypothetical protein
VSVQPLSLGKSRQSATFRAMVLPPTGRCAGYTSAHAPPVRHHGSALANELHSRFRAARTNRQARGSDVPYACSVLGPVGAYRNACFTPAVVALPDKTDDWSIEVAPSFR